MFRFSPLVALVVLVASISNSSAELISFEDGAANEHIGEFYASLGVTFYDAVWSEADQYAPSAMAVGHASEGSEPKADTPIIVTFNEPQSSVSILALGVGENGARLEAFDAVIGGNLLDLDETVGSTYGSENHVPLTVNGSGIRRLHFYQPFSSLHDGTLLDDLNFVPIPEPSTIILLLTGALGLLVHRIRRK